MQSSENFGLQTRTNTPPEGFETWFEPVKDRWYGLHRSRGPIDQALSGNLSLGVVKAKILGDSLYINVAYKMVRDLTEVDLELDLEFSRFDGRLRFSG